MQVPNQLRSAGGRVRAKARTAARLAQSRRALARAAGSGPPVRSRASAAVACDHLSVLDGVTLNVCVTLDPADADGPVTLRVANERRVVGDFAMTSVADDGRTRCELTVAVSPDWAPRTVGAGRAGTVAFKVLADGRAFDLLPPPPAHLDGPTVATPPRPDLGFGLHIVTGYGGRVFLRFAPTPPRAHVTTVDVGWTHVTVNGTLFGATPDTVDTLLLCDRAGSASHRVPVVTDGADFSCALPIDVLTGSRTERVWDFRLRLADGGSLRLGRWSTDVTDPKRVFRQPGRVLAGPDGESAHCDVYYTPAGSLALRTSPLSGGVPA